MVAVNFDDLVAMQDPHERGHGSTPPPPGRPTPAPPATPKVLPPVMRVTDWDWRSNPTGWWCSEKFDGCRAWWDGTNLVSRRGNEYAAPDWFKRQLPRIPLDGELWLGRGRFSETVGVSRAGTDADWREIRFMVFDAPTIDEPFEIRLREIFGEVQLCGFHQVIPVIQTLVRSMDHLEEMLTQVENQAGEGLVLRRSGSRYTEGASLDIQRVVRVRTDEAVIVGHTRGAGNRANGVGAFICRLKNGIEFRCGTGLKTKDIQNPPAIGTTITFGYKNLTHNGVPREPRFIRVREDD